MRQRMLSLKFQRRWMTHATKGSLDIRNMLQERISSAVIKSFGPDIAFSVKINVSAILNEEHGHYQCISAMPLAKLLKMKPRDVALKLFEHLETENLIESTEVAGPGFINIRLSPQFVIHRLNMALRDPKQLLAIQTICNQTRKKIIIDYSSPNIAKEMHVGHLRSTILGDALSRILELLGHEILRINHVGDWGTQFGMLIHYLKETQGEEGLQNLLNNSLQNESSQQQFLLSLYRQARERFTSDPEFERKSKLEVFKLQNNDPTNIKLWEFMCHMSRIEFMSIYKLLNIDTRLIERGESFYNPLLPNIVKDLIDKRIASRHDEAVLIYESTLDLQQKNEKGKEKGKGKEGKSDTQEKIKSSNENSSHSALMIQKSDGAYLYGTTDIAAVYQRCSVEKADRILYVTDMSQGSHFKMVFTASQLAGYTNSHTTLEHVGFGLVLGEDNKRLRSRSGDTYPLRDLLDLAIQSARDLVIQRQQTNENENTKDDHSTKWTQQKINHLAHVIGIGAVKYADLSMNRESGYKFSLEKMLSFDGNTAPYMLYAFVRVMGIYRRAHHLEMNLNFESIHVISTREELLLSLHLIKFSEIIEDISKNLYPNRLCDYLFELSQKFNQFYERCPVLNADNNEIRNSRLLLCKLTADTLRVGLHCLGVETVDEI